MDPVTAAGIVAVTSRWIVGVLQSDRWPLIAGVTAGGVAAGAAVWYAESVPGDFYAACAQINPVFLVALVLEQRLAERLGGTINDYEQAALAAWNELPPQPGVNLEIWRGSHPDFLWLERLPVGRPVVVEAQAMYRRRSAQQSLLVIVTVASLLLGQVASLVGLLLDGTDANSGWFFVTAATLVCSFTIIVSSALAELLRSILK